MGAVALVASVPLGAQDGDSATPWTDLDAARAQLDEARVEAADAQRALEDAQAQMEALQADREASGASELAYAFELQESGDLAVDLAIDAYINRGRVAEAIYLIDSDTASDLAYRTGLLSGSADAVATTSRRFLSLKENASAESLALADEIARVADAVEAAQRLVATAESAVADAEYVVWIAEIHDRADALAQRNGYPEPTAEQWADLRFCESTGRYDVATGNGYWGAYQFDIPTWSDMGGSGLPSDAPPEEQDARARYLYHLRGWGPWPVCGRFLPQDSPGPR